ncbi:Uncharacterized protein FKW44_025180 [Caligus rogercresseyi]|uniref:Uncharacterized protein n=1 Tax=Caligus rogercresseyi TaxID=217165 RepID=A0A7T8GKY9_CALRO|nr:Uncharacterized protein FKW44_025180 [Caligus rogercresseyi]
MGGLGLMQFRSKIVCARNGAAKAAANSSDPLVKAAVKVRPTEQALSSCLIGGRPVTDRESARRQLAEELYRKIDTAGSASFKKGIRNSQYLSGSRFLIEDKEFLAAIQILGGAPFVKSKKARFTPGSSGANARHVLRL